MNVQGWADVDGSSADGDTYEPMTCLACRQIHLVNPVAGKLLSDAEG